MGAMFGDGSGAGSGRSKTWRALWPVVIAKVMAEPQVAQDAGK
jgi:hypothetical protein